ncbi:MAG: hypothetical protein AAFU65_09795 [Pseudomonadota bacterium]
MHDALNCGQRAVIGALLFAAAPVAPADDAPYAFDAFQGVWTLEDDRFEQVWDGKTLQTLEIPNHITRCDPVNTNHSILCAVDAGDLKGHILWVVDDQGQRVEHLSHFGTRRVGTGQGQLDEAGNLTLTLRFADEPANTYRRYRYEWLDADRYKMTSVQYRDDNTPTGNWYGGTFVRLNPPR